MGSLLSDLVMSTCVTKFRDTEHRNLKSKFFRKD